MQGPEGAATHTADWMRSRLPYHLRRIEVRLSTAEETVRLPDPVQVLDHEVGPLGIEYWPTVYVLPQKMEGMTLVDVRGDASETYRVVYSVRVLLWVRANSYLETDQLRKRYVLAVRETLLERKSLTPAATYGSGDYGTATEETVVDPSTFREDYSDIMTDDAGRTIAGAYLDFSLITSETTASPDPLGTAAAIDVGIVGTEDPTAPLPEHPAFL